MEKSQKFSTVRFAVKKKAKNVPTVSRSPVIQENMQIIYFVYAINPTYFNVNAFSLTRTRCKFRTPTVFKKLN